MLHDLGDVLWNFVEHGHPEGNLLQTVLAQSSFVTCLVYVSFNRCFNICLVITAQLANLSRNHMLLLFPWSCGVLCGGKSESHRQDCQCIQATEHMGIATSQATIPWRVRGPVNPSQGQGSPYQVQHTQMF